MNDQTKTITPHYQSVVRFIQENTISFLDGCKTLSIDELLEKLNAPRLSKLSLVKIKHIFITARSVGSYTGDDFFEDLHKVITTPKIDINDRTLIANLIDGESCMLLQPDGQGWRKGKLKLSFEFIPDENESTQQQERAIELQDSPLDKIRHAEGFLPDPYKNLQDSLQILARDLDKIKPS